MPKLPVVSGGELIKFFVKEGYEKSSSHGDHVTLVKVIDNKPFLVTVPLYKEISRGLLLRIIKQSHLPKEEFLEKIRSK